jgi:hypothetical protein
LEVGAKYFGGFFEIVFDEGCQTGPRVLDGVIEPLDRHTGAVSEKEPVD